MLDMAVLALIGATSFMTIFHLWDDDDDRSRDDGPGEEPGGEEPGGEEPGGEEPEPGSPFEVVSLDTLYSGDGDDVIRAGEEGVSGVDIHAEGGDDTITLATSDTTIDGGDGDDVIDAGDYSYNVTLLGGAGNDTIDGSGVALGVIDGGDGDDAILLDVSDYSDERVEAYGGAGDDRIEVTLPVSGTDDPAGLPYIVGGGEGSDTFDVSIDEGTAFGPGGAFDGPPVAHGPILLVTDFEPGVDTLFVDPTGPGGDPIGAPFQHAELVEAEDGTYTDLVLHYGEGPEVGVAQSAAIRLSGVTGLTMDDIVLTETGELPGGEIEIVSGQSLTAGPGDDVITSQELNLEFVQVDAGAGDDVVDLTAYTATVRGGAGDDTLLVRGSDAVVDGGEGNDTLDAGDYAYAMTLQGGDGDDVIIGSGLASGAMEGGDGDDMLVFDPGSFSDERISLDAGAGDDRLIVELPISGAPDLYARPAVLTGGDGADSFELTFNTGPGVGPGGETDADPVEHGTILSIADFEVGTDSLVVTTVSDVGAPFVGAELVEAEDGTHTDLVLNYGAVPEVGVAQSAVISLNGVTGLTLDDIVLTEIDPEPGEGYDILVSSGFRVIAGSGDDSITSTEAYVSGAEIDAGGGDDTVDLSGDSLVIEGGDGDDTIVGSMFGSTVSGGDGADTLEVASANGDQSTLSGGAGADFIRAEGSNNVVIFGDEGRDEITFSGAAPDGNGYDMRLYGGQGDDSFTGTFSPESVRGVQVYGGAGQDLFDITIDEGPGPDLDMFFEQVDETTTRGWAAYLDFTPGEDQLIVRPDVGSPDTTLDRIEVRESATSVGSTDVTLHYRLLGGGERQIIIELTDATGLTEDDVIFAGLAPQNGVVFA